VKLELGKIEIDDIRFSDKTKIKDHVLYINKDELLETINGNEDIG
jgi:glycine reductase